MKLKAQLLEIGTKQVAVQVNDILNSTVYTTDNTNTLDVIASTTTGSEDNTTLHMAENQAEGSAVYFSHSQRLTEGFGNIVAEKTTESLDVRVGKVDGLFCSMKLDIVTGDIQILVDGTPKILVHSNGSIEDIG